MKINLLFGLLGMAMLVLSGCQISGDFIPDILSIDPRPTNSRSEFRRLGPVPKPDSRVEILWGTDLREALVQAKNSDKRVMLIFTNSDCGYVNARWNHIYTQTEFLDLAEPNLVLVKVDLGGEARVRIQKNWWNCLV